MLSSSKRTSPTVFLAVNILGLRQKVFSSQVINQGQDFMEQALWHGNLGQLGCGIATMADDRGPNLDPLLPLRS